MKRHVLPHSVLPTRLPLQTTALVYLLLDRFDPPGWTWGVVWTVMVLLWIGVVINKRTEVTKPLAGYGDAP
jgi:hypothetical protein